MIELETASCPLCGALVLRTDKQIKLHEEWHERQTKILETLAEIHRRVMDRR